MEILGIDNIVFTVGDISQAVEFYLKLGLRLQFRSEQAGAAVMVISAEHPNLLLLKGEDKKGGLEHPCLWVEVKDARMATKELVEKGFRFAREPFLIPTGWLAEVMDPWGNIIGFNDYHLQPQFGRAGGTQNRKDPVS
ncbi:MAG TPA: VOC family protein [bacterium]|nr:VOC family protein [bacterium]